MIEVVAVLLLLGLIFLARDADITQRARKWIRDRSIRGKRISAFVHAMLECAPCVAAWCAPPAYAISWALPKLNPYLAGPVFLLLVLPVCGVGLLYGLTLLSPAQMIETLQRRTKNRKEDGHGPQGS